jgi:hypothetical protein
MKPKRRYNKDYIYAYYTIKYSKVLHREDGPALIYNDGTKHWYRYGRLHRLGGPAAEWESGTMEWCVNGRYHREDGPAVERSNGGKEWWIDGKRHRVDGPAIISGGGEIMWYLNNKCYTKEEWFEALTPEQQQMALFSGYFIN